MRPDRIALIGLGTPAGTIAATFVPAGFKVTGSPPRPKPCPGAARRRSAQPHQQPGHQAGALCQAGDLDMFVERMQPAPQNAQRIQRRDPHRAGEVAVGAAALAAPCHLEPQLLGDLLGNLEDL